MKRIIIAILLTLTAYSTLQAQLRVTEECRVKEGDITAYRMNDREPVIIDGDTVSYAIVRVGLTEPNAKFDSRWALKQEFKDNEYWVYFMEGVKSMTVTTKRFAPLHYKFPAPLEAKSVYVMTIERPDKDKYKGELNIASNVAKAEIYVDGVKVSDGTPYRYTGDAGKHRIELRAEGNAPQEREIDIPMGQSKSVTINLFDAGSLTVDGIAYGMVPVDAATYRMGSDANYYTRPARDVSLRPFSAGSMLVSADLWKAVTGETDDRIQGSDGQAVNVSYDEIQDFISILNEKTGKEFRLPTEAEWEYLRKNKSRLGIADIGTGMEWCADWFGKYSLNDTTNPQGAEEGVLRAVRGGSEYADIDPAYMQPEFRWRKDPQKGSPRISFRLVSDN